MEIEDEISADVDGTAGLGRARPAGLRRPAGVGSGGEEIRDLLEHLETKLGIHDGEVTPDGKFSLVRVECLGSCGTAPMFQMNDDYHEDLTPERIDQLLDSLP